MKKLIGTLFVFALIISGLTLQSYQSHAEKADPNLSAEDFEIEIDTLYRVLETFNTDVVQTVIDEINDDNGGIYDEAKKKKKKKKKKTTDSCSGETCDDLSRGTKYCTCQATGASYPCGCAGSKKFMDNGGAVEIEGSDIGVDKGL